MAENLRLGDILVQDGAITSVQLSAALEAQKLDRGKRVGEILLEQEAITEEELVNALSARLSLEIIDPKNAGIDLEIAALIPKALSVKYNALALTRTDDAIKVVLSDPLDLYAVEDIKSFLNEQIKICIGARSDIRKLIDKSYSEIGARSAATVANKSVGAKVITELKDISMESDDNPIVNIVNSIITKGHSEGASDIHIEPFEHYVNVRFRVDGQLLEYMQLESELAAQISTRIKILSDLDIAARRSPQDGNFKIQVSSQQLGVRVSVLPTLFGEKIVLRFLAQSVLMDNSGTFGMNQANYERIARILTSPHGIVYITGPTGSGKTTTLYMMIENMALEPINVSTIEDPVERNLRGIVQTQVNPAAGMTFSAGLRSLLRQDPDVILLGETRDSETAQIAVSAAITGHLVLSTLHTNDAISSIVRLGDMGIPNYLIANSLTGLVAQRLVKKICPFCKVPYEPTMAERKMLPEVEQFYHGAGCNSCGDSGYKGRISIHEVLEMDREIRSLIAGGGTTDGIYNYVKETGKMPFLKDNIAMLVQEGVTTTEEYIKQTAFVV